MNFYTSEILFQKDSSYKMPVLVGTPSRLISEVWAKYKDVSTKILKCDAKTNSSKKMLKIYI